MKRFYLKLFFVFLLLVCFKQSNATHIVGGELYYKYLGSNNYEITLIVYRDCYTGNPPFDDPGAIGIFDVNNVLLFNLQVPVDPDSITIPPTINSPCFIPPTDVCYRRAFYKTTVNLPPLAGGYQLVYQRCCRNQSILNIVDPLSTGITIYATIPSSNSFADNSNPVYNELPPPFLCLAAPFVFDHSATDADGDSLVYELCDPLDGASFNNPAPNPPFDPPYLNVQWQAPFGPANLLGGVPLTINAQTGLLTATPNTIGQFVIGVCVSEFRNGILLGKTRRDYQFNVVPCPSLVVAALQSPLINCGSNVVTFQNNSIGAASYDWNFGDPTTLGDTSHASNPTYTYPTTGTYTVTLIAHSGFNPGCADTTTGIVNLYPPFEADFTFIQPPCSLGVSFTATSQNSGSGLSDSWNWNFGDNGTSIIQNPSHIYPAAGTYTVTLVSFSDSGCVDTVRKNITIQEQLAATIASSQPISCFGDCNATAAATPTSGVGPYQYQWNDPNNQTTQTATGLCSGTYSVVISDVNSCSTTKSITINSPTPLTLGVSSTDAYCGGRCIGTATAITGGATLPYTYLWNDPAGQQTQSASLLCPGLYTVVVTDARGCTRTDSVTVNFSNFIPPLNVTSSNDTIFEGQSIQFASTVYINATYAWIPGTNLNNESISNPSATYNTSGTFDYEIIMVDSNGCENRDTISILVRKVTCREPELFIPNAFTPNNDLNNDVLYVRGNTIKELLFRVYDRWGEKVFETNIPNTGWDGTYKNKPVQPGVYDYYLEATCFDNEKFFKKGNVTVIK